MRRGRKQEDRESQQECAKSWNDAEHDALIAERVSCPTGVSPDADDRVVGLGLDTGLGGSVPSLLGLGEKRTGYLAGPLSR
jgi:hypothetical protein